MTNQRLLEIGGGVVDQAAITRLTLPAGLSRYADAQIDDYGLAASRRNYVWQPGTRLSLRARFSHEPEVLVGTAGFGFWNAPFGDPTLRTPALPRAVWFFFASPPSDLPLTLEGPGRGWFASTIDARRPAALALIPFTPFIIALNQGKSLRKRIWSAVRQRLAISFADITTPLIDWHDYAIDWRQDGCRFLVDGISILDTPHSPAGPLGFVCWIDNQYLIATPRGRFASGALATSHEQWLEIADLTIA